MLLNPVLSILLITHNQRELLQRCLDSVLAQELRVPFEIIVSDDRSTDGTREWCLSKKCCGKGKRTILWKSNIPIAIRMIVILLRYRNVAAGTN